MATDSDLDSWEFERKAEKSSYCGVNEAQSNKIHEYDFDLASKSSRSEPEFRFINPAIYAESFKADENCGDHEERFIKRAEIHSHGYDDSSPRAETRFKYKTTALTDEISFLSISNGEESSRTIDVDGDHAPETYRCLPSVSSTTTSSSLNSCNQQSRSSKPIERRCKLSDDLQASWESKSSEDLASSRQYERKNVLRCSLNGLKNIQSSSTSLSTTNLSERQTINGVPISRQVAHAEWVREKEREALKIKEEKRRVEQNKKDQEERIRHEREERERRERESFLRWAERKRKEEVTKQESVERELELQRRLKEVEDKAAIAKTIYLRQWARKKEEEQKAQQRREQMKNHQKEEEKKKRLEESVKAYEKWREKSKDKPKPATQAHQKAKPAFVNPNPWQKIIEDEEELDGSKEPPKDPTERKKILKLGNDKNKSRKTRSSHQ